MIAHLVSAILATTTGIFAESNGNGTLLLLALLLGACLGERQQPSYTQHGIARDTLYSIDYRGNGAVLLFFTHDDVSGYCFSDKAKIDQAEDLIKNWNGEVLIDYESQITGLADFSPLDPQGLCRMTEPSMTIYLGRTLTKVPARTGGK